MAWNGSGIFSRIHNWVADRDASINITASRCDAEDDNFQAGIQACLTKNGENSPTANLPMATYRHTGVGNATALTDYASADQVVDNALTYGGASSGGTDAYAVNLPISPGAYVAGQRYQFLSDVANTGACSINFNSLGVKSIKLIDGNDPFTGDIKANAPVDVQYDGTNFILLNPFASVNIQNFIEGSGQTYLTSDGDQLEKGVSIYSHNGNFYTAGGTANAITLTVLADRQSLSAYADGQIFTFEVSTTNTGATTANVSGIGAKNIFWGGAALSGGELIAGMSISVRYDSSDDRFDLISRSYREMIAEITVTGSAVTSVSFSGLDMATHKNYKITAEIINATASVAQVYLYVNGDTTATNYYSQTLSGVGASPGSARVNTPVIMTLDASSQSHANIMTFRNPTHNRFYAISNTARNAGSGIITEQFSMSSTTSIGNITSLDITSTVASSIGVGSIIRIYRNDK